MAPKLSLLLVAFILIFFAPLQNKQIGETEITKWQHGKQAAVSLTYDDSTINQFRVALPLMNELGFPGTFYLVTGAIPGSEYKPKFVGRPVEQIIAETAEVPTNEENFLKELRPSDFQDMRERTNIITKQRVTMDAVNWKRHTM